MNPQTEQVVNDLLTGNEDNIAKFIRDNAVGAVGVLSAEYLNYTAQLGIPPVVASLIGLTAALLVYREARKRGLLKFLGVQPK